MHAYIHGGHPGIGCIYFPPDADVRGWCPGCSTPRVSSFENEVLNYEQWIDPLPHTQSLVNVCNPGRLSKLPGHDVVLRADTAVVKQRYRVP